VECIKSNRSQGNSNSAEVGNLMQNNFIFYIQILGDCLLPITIYRYKGADNSLARTTSRYTFYDGRSLRFILDSLHIYINSINVPPIIIINKIYEKQNLLSI
jgi:hypothetical protein